MKNAVLVVCCLAGLCACSRTQHARPVRYILNDGTVGWVKINYNRPGAPELPVMDGFEVVHISRSLHMATHSRMNPSWNGSEFYYQHPNGQLVRLPTGDDDKRRLWGQEKSSDSDGDYEVFFVGGQSQFTQVDAAAGDMGTGLLHDKPQEPEKEADPQRDILKIETSLTK